MVQAVRREGGVDRVGILNRRSELIWVAVSDVLAGKVWEA